MARLWNGSAFRTTLGSLVTSLVRLFTAQYEWAEETEAVGMVHEAMVRGCTVANDPRYSSSNIWDVYRMRAGFLVGFVNFRSLLERMELNGRIGRKHKTFRRTRLSRYDRRQHRFLFRPDHER
jgi:hypothetical protein